MRQVFVPVGQPLDDAGTVVTTREEVEDYCPWAVEIIECAGGYRCFESVADAATWRGQV